MKISTRRILQLRISVDGFHARLTRSELSERLSMEWAHRDVQCDIWLSLPTMTARSLPMVECRRLRSRQSLAFARPRRRAILVTGRRVEDLLAVCPHVDLFDYVVAENGAVVG